MKNTLQYSQQTIALVILASIASSTLIACGSSDTNEKDTAAAGSNAVHEETSTSVETEEALLDSRFDGVDYGGRAFRVLSSFDDHDATNAHLLIAGTGETNGDPVNDTVYERNSELSELLNIKLEFTPTDYTFINCEENLRKLVMAGDDLYDVIINDIRSLASLSVEGMFMNIYNEKNFDMSKNYWYKDCMDDLMLIEGKEFVLAGDFFMDLIGSCHAMFYNKEMTAAYYDDADYIYQLVADGKWTYDTFVKLCEENYQDLNGDGHPNYVDRYGLVVSGTWGCALPFIGSAGIEFINRDPDNPQFIFNNERSIKFLESLNRVFWNPGTYQTGDMFGSEMAEGLRGVFASGQSLFLTYNRLGDLAKMRDIEFDIGVIPYPKLEETDDYITSIHDTSEVGAIPVTIADLDFVTMVLEAASQITSKNLMPEYYESALKIKYTTDTTSAEMIDLIHDSIGSSLPLSYNSLFGDFMLNTFTDSLSKQSNDFASHYKSKEKRASRALEIAFENLTELEN